MKAIVGTGNAETLASMQDVEDPCTPEDEALVAVKAFSLNQGELKRLLTWPEGWRPGWDFSGEVVKAAEGGKGPPVGARVVGFLWEGAWAERIAVPPSNLSEIPDTVSFSAAATLPVAGLTALGILRLGGPILGKEVLVTGASGGVGQLAVQLANRAGASVTAVVSRPERASGLEGLGARKVVVGMGDLTQRYDLILDAVGGDYLTQSLSHVAADGDVVTYGRSSGEMTTFDPYDLFMEARAARLHGFRLGTGSRAEAFSADLQFLAELVGNGELDVGVSQVASWHDAVSHFKALLERKVSGKTVLEVD